MNILKQIRTSTGITQSMLAAWLGISRTTLVRAEHGSGSLTTSALIKLNELYRSCQETEKSMAADKPVNCNQTKVHEKLLRRCRYDTARFQRKLQQVEASFVKYSKLVAVLSLLEKGDNQYQEWIKDQRQRVAAKLLSCDENYRARLKRKIYLLCAEATYIEQLSGKDPFMKNRKQSFLKPFKQKKCNTQ